tara:strand:+ start:47266 stop:47520 length:255 start_codon:yes stop_codon:yes gene_type:complete
MNSTDRIRLRTVQNLLKLIEHHLEAMQRDVHGLEYAHWKEEVDGLWRNIFGKINLMSDSSQQVALELIREDWTSYVTHYVGISR